MLEDRRLLATINVTSAADDGSANTLRWAIGMANNADTPTSIAIELGTAPAMITLALGQLELSNTKYAITIYDGSGQGPVTISGNGVSRVFQVDSQVTATITGLTIASGVTNGSGGGVYNEKGASLNLQNCIIESSSANVMGGGLDSNGRATLTGCTISGNKSSSWGAGIENHGYYPNAAAMTLTDCILSGNSSNSGAAGLNTNGTVELTNCTLSGNTSGSSGAIATENGWADLTRCTISNNFARGSAGGFASFGGTAPSELTDCTISGNTTSGPGGALDNMGGAVYLTNCTLADNTSQSRGGGVAIEGGATVDLTDCTLSSNTTPGLGGGVYNGGMATLADTIIAGNSSGTGGDIDGGGTLTGSYNLVGRHSGGLESGQDGNIVDVTDPVLSALGNYGGLTQTMAILPGSAAVGAGTPESGATTDQRGDPLNSPTPDIGAYQSQGFTLALVTDSTPQSAGLGSEFANPLAVTATANEPDQPVAGGIVTYTASPASNGASANLSSATATVGDDGTAKVNATADSTVGDYTVTASIAVGVAVSFSLDNLPQPVFTGLTNPSITYGTSSVTIAGTLAGGPPATSDESVAITLGSTTQDATIGSEGAFSSSFNTAHFGVVGSPYPITYTYSGDADFGFASATGSLTVTKATPTITWADPADIAYRTPLTDTQLDASPSVPGLPSYTPAAGTVLPVGDDQTLSVSFTPSDTADYNDAVGSAMINVDKATPEITWPNPADIVYGTPLSGTQLDATALVPGSFSYTPGPGTMLNAGEDQTLSVLFTPSDSIDYDDTVATAVINVAQVTPTLTWTTPAPITYGTALSVEQLNATASVPGKFIYTPPAGTVLGFGTGQELSVSFTPTDSVDYTGATDSVMITVTKAKPTITWANPASITYGTPLSVTQLDATASVPGMFTYTPAAGTVLDAGTHQALSVSFAPTDSTDYTTAAASARITVTKATPVITWSDPDDITYGTALSLTQLDATASVPGMLTYAPAAGVVLGAGADQTLSVSFAPTDSSDYTTATGAVAINVEQAVPAITWASPADIPYGTPLSGAQLDTTSPVAGSFTYTPAAGTVLTPGAGQVLSALFTPTDGVDYTTATGTMTINVTKTELVTTWSTPAEITYGTPLSGTQLDARANIPGAFTYQPTAGTLLAAGSGHTLAATFAPTDLTDYTPTQVSTTIAVAKATPLLTLSDPGGEHDGAPFGASVTVAGVANDSSSSASLEGVAPTLTYFSGTGTTGPNLGTAAPAGAGVYTVVASFAGSADYAAVQSAPVTFTITAGTDAIGLSVSTASSVFGEPITLVARVTSSVAPGGTVTFFNGGNALGTVALNSSGAAVLTTSALAAGPHSVTATYSGDASLPTAASGAASESVSQSGTSVVLVPNPVRKKKKIKSEILTAKIEPISPGGGIPTGTVIFELLTKKKKKTLTKTLGTAAVNDGAGTLTLKPAKVLGKPITIVFSGDANFDASSLAAPKLSKKGLL
jgi:hypothetical protein